MMESHISGFPIILPKHRAEFYQLNPDWHTEWLHSIHNTVNLDDRIVDVGVEQGDLSALVAGWIPEGGLWMLEPVAAFWPTIRTVFETNSLSPPEGATVAFASDAATDPPAVTYTDEWPPETERRMINDPGFQHLSERPDLPAVRLDDFVPASANRLLIDVEGAELKVLRGAEGWLSNGRPTVWCAIHTEMMHPRYGDTPNRLMAYMAGLGYRWDFIAFHGELHFRFDPR